MNHRCTGEFCEVCKTIRLIYANLDSDYTEALPDLPEQPTSGPGIPSVTCETLQHRDLAAEAAYDEWRNTEGYVPGGFDPYAETDGRTVGVFSAAGGYQSTDQIDADRRQAAEAERRHAEHVANAPRYRR